MTQVSVMKSAVDLLSGSSLGSLLDLLDLLLVESRLGSVLDSLLDLLLAESACSRFDSVKNS